MKVQLIAYTAINSKALREIGYNRHESDTVKGLYSNFDADELAEFAGRNCYRSFHRPNPKTAANKDYLAHIIESGHESVLEHASATFYIEASRSVLAEITRHRHLSFSVVSQRYVNVPELGDHMPPAFHELEDVSDKAEASAIYGLAWNGSVDAYKRLVDIYSRNGLPRKKAREAARAVLPNMTNSPMVVSGNHRAWRYFIRARWHEAADAEIRELAGAILRRLREIAPNTYQDIPNEPGRMP